MKVESFDIDCLGYKLDADYYDNGGDKVLLSLIGWTSEKGRYKDILEGICRRTGMDALVFDYSGHGTSKFPIEKTRPAQHFLEVICAYDWLKENRPGKEIVVMGASYGGYMAALLSQHRPVSRQVIRAPGLYKPEDFYSYAPDWRKDTLYEYRQNPKLVEANQLFEDAKSYKGRTLVVVHEKDEQIPRVVTDAYIKAFDADVYLAEGLMHSFGVNPPRGKVERYQEAISEWLKK
ncbi:MAG TPA: alpha/beta fold hydrolase [Candidatus Saccharimonadales bacterium]|nr:alpha/beta fold hydrolase [Candidatus Saccharimonadales bacterium]